MAAATSEPEVRIAERRPVCNRSETFIDANSSVGWKRNEAGSSDIVIQLSDERKPSVGVYVVGSPHELNMLAGRIIAAVAWHEETFR